MVRGMVERLAERLKRDGSDVEGWLRLVRAYTVIGQSQAGAVRRGPTHVARSAMIPTSSTSLMQLVKELQLEELNTHDPQAATTGPDRLRHGRARPRRGRARPVRA